MFNFPSLHYFPRWLPLIALTSNLYYHVSTRLKPIIQNPATLQATPGSKFVGQGYPYINTMRSSSDEWLQDQSTLETLTFRSIMSQRVVGVRTTLGRVVATLRRRRVLVSQFVTVSMLKVRGNYTSIADTRWLTYMPGLDWGEQKNYFGRIFIPRHPSAVRAPVLEDMLQMVGFYINWNSVDLNAERLCL